MKLTSRIFHLHKIFSPSISLFVDGGNYKI